MHIFKCWRFLFLNHSACQIKHVLPGQGGAFWGTTHIVEPPCLTMTALQWREGWAGSPRKGPAAQARSSLGRRTRVGGNTQRSNKDRAAAWVRMTPTGSLVTLDVFPKHLLSSHRHALRFLLPTLQPTAFHTGLHTPKPSSQPAPGASHQIRGFRAGTGVPLQHPTADTKSTGHRNLTPKHSATVSIRFCPLRLCLSTRCPRGRKKKTSQAFNVVLHVSLLLVPDSQMQQLRRREVQQLAQSHTANRCENGVQGIWPHILQGPRIPCWSSAIQSPRAWDLWSHIVVMH